MMGSKTLKYCDVCGTEYDYHDQYDGFSWSGHIRYRLYTPNGQIGNKVDLCPQHAKQVYELLGGIDEKLTR